MPTFTTIIRDVVTILGCPGHAGRSPLHRLLPRHLQSNATVSDLGGLNTSWYLQHFHIQQVSHPLEPLALVVWPDELIPISLHWAEVLKHLSGLEDEGAGQSQGVIYRAQCTQKSLLGQRLVHMLDPVAESIFNIPYTPRALSSRGTPRALFFILELVNQRDPLEDCYPVTHEVKTTSC